MNSDKVSIIVNSKSNLDGLEQLVEAIRKVAPEPTVRMTSGPGDAINLTRSAVDDGSTIIAGWGGDGTEAERITGLMRARGSPDSGGSAASDDLKFIAFPKGTGNDWARGACNLTSADEAQELLITYLTADPSTRPSYEKLVNIGKLSSERRQFLTPGEKQELYVLNLWDLGFGPLVVRNLKSLRAIPHPLQRLIGNPYEASAVYSYLGYRSPIRVRGLHLNGREVYRNEPFFMLLATNSGIGGGNMGFGPFADPTHAAWDFNAVRMPGPLEFKAIMDEITDHDPDFIKRPEVDHFSDAYPVSWHQGIGSIRSANIYIKGKPPLLEHDGELTRLVAPELHFTVIPGAVCYLAKNAGPLDRSLGA